MSGKIVLTNSSPDNMFQPGIGRLLLSAASMQIMCALAIVCFYEKREAKTSLRTKGKTKMRAQNNDQGT